MSSKRPTFEELNQQQRKVYEIALKDGVDLIVTGGPGTGKSILALNIYESLSGDKNLISYHKILTNYLKESSNNKNDRNIINADSYILSELRKISGKNTDFQGKDYEQEIENQIKSHLDNSTILNKPESIIIIDEAQDLTASKHLFLKHNNKKRIIFLDDKQKVIDNGTNRRELLSEIYNDNVDEFVLNINYRNTRQISFFSKCIFPTEQINFQNRSGELPYLINSKNEIEMIKEISKIIDNNPTKSILILLPYMTEKSEHYFNFFNDTKKQIINLSAANKDRISFEIGESRLIKFDYNNVHIINTNLHKGLEYDIVIMPYLNDDFYDGVNFDNNSGKIYVGITRANEKLYLLYSGENKSTFISKINEFPDNFIKV